MEINIGETGFRVIKETIVMKSQPAGAEYFSSRPHLIINFVKLLDRTMNFIRKIPRHPQTDYLYAFPINKDFTVSCKFNIMKILFEGILKNFQRFFSGNLNKIFCSADILSADIHITILCQIGKYRGKPIGTITILPYTYHNTICKNLSLFVTENCMAKSLHSQFCKIIDTNRIQKFHCVRAIDIINWRSGKRRTNPCAFTVSVDIFYNSFKLIWL